MTVIQNISQSDVQRMIDHGVIKAYDAPTAKCPMLEIHNVTGQAYPRTVANFERTRRMAAKIRGMTSKLDREYVVYKLVTELDLV